MNGTFDMNQVNLWELKQPAAVLTLLTIAYTSVFALSLIGNVAVIATVYRLPSMHTTINYFICNLSTADVLMAFLCLPLNLVSNTFTNWVAGKALCKAMPYLQGVAVAASVTTLSVIAFDRYLAICRPLKRHLSKKQTVGFIVAIWTYVLALLSPWVFYYDRHLLPLKDGNATFLACVNTMTPLYNKVYQMAIIFCLLYAGPLFFIVVCYSLVAHKLSRRTINQEEFLRKSSTEQDKKQMSRLIKMLATVVLIFALSWLPLHVMAITLLFVPQKPWFMPYLERGMPMVQWIAISNCCVNPWIYCAFSKSYRTNFLNTLRCKFRSPQAGQSIAAAATTGSVKCSLTASSRQRQQLLVNQQHQEQERQSATQANVSSSEWRPQQRRRPPLSQLRGEDPQSAIPLMERGHQGCELGDNNRAAAEDVEDRRSSSDLE